MEDKLENALKKKVDFEKERIRIDDEIYKRKSKLFRDQFKKIN